MKLKKILSLLLATTMMLSMVACSDDSTSGSGSEGGTGSEGGSTANVPQELTFATASDVLTMDPAMGSSTPNWAGQAPVYENLVTLVATEDNGTKIVPGVAETWDVSEDGLVYTFNLREDAKWSDGVPVTAEDFVYTWQRTYDPEVGAVYTWMIESVVKNGKEVYAGELPVEELGVRAVDTHTFEVTLTEPSPFFMQFAAFPTYCPVRKDVVEMYGSEYGSAPDKIVGNGAYVLKSWDPGASMIYEKNENYWNKDEVHLTKITRQIIKETNAVAQSLLANEVDIAGLDNPQWNQLVDATGVYDVHSMPNIAIENFLFNCADPILQNQKIRLALSLALDREKYNAEALEGVNVPAYSMVPTVISVGDLNYAEASNFENEHIKVLLEEYDPKELLLEGMAELGLGDDPSTISIEYATRGTSEFSKKTAEWMKQNIEEALGINFVIEMTEWNIMYEMIDSGDYQIAQGGWTGDYSDPSNFLDNYHPVIGYYNADKTNWTGEGADEYARLIDAAKQATDDQERVDLYADAEKILLEEAPVSPQYTTKIRTLVGKYVDGYYVNPMVYPNYVGVKMLEK